MVRTWIIREDLFPSQKKKSLISFWNQWSRFNAIAFVKLKSRFLKTILILCCFFSWRYCPRQQPHYDLLGFEAASYKWPFLGCSIREPANWGSPSAPGGLWVLLAHPDEVAGQWPVRPHEQCCALQLLWHDYQAVFDQVGAGSASPILMSPFWHVVVGARERKDVSLTVTFPGSLWTLGGNFTGWDFSTPPWPFSFRSGWSSRHPSLIWASTMPQKNEPQIRVFLETP